MRRLARFLFGALACCVSLDTDSAAGQGIAAGRTGVAGLVLRGQVVMPDGSPAAAVDVALMEQLQDLVLVRTDESGFFEATATCGQNLGLFAANKDRSLQAEVWVLARLARTQLAEPLRIMLEPARSIGVRVTKDGQPVPHCLLDTLRSPLSRSETDASGETTLHVPANHRLKYLSAFHPTLGIAGWNQRNSPIQLGEDDHLHLQLLPPRGYLVRVIDQFGRGVPECEIGVDVVIAGTALSMSRIPQARAVTLSDGSAKFDWIPQDGQYLVDVFRCDLWTTEFCARTADESRTTTGVRRRVPIRGRLVFPDGKPQQGVLVSARSDAPHLFKLSEIRAKYGDIESMKSDATTARSDDAGHFTLNVAPDHAYAIAVQDNEWGADVWTGVLARSTEDSYKKEIDELRFEVKPTTPVTLIATRFDGTPMPHEFISVDSRRDFQWTLTTGEKEVAGITIRSTIETDSGGVARFGIADGLHEISIRDGDWRESREIDPTGREQIELTFVRPAKHTISGQIVSTEHPSRDWKDAIIISLGRIGTREVRVESITDGRGEFSLATDAESVTLFAFSRDASFSGMTEATTASPTEIRMSPSAEYSGVAINGMSQPLANRKLVLFPLKIWNTENSSLSAMALVSQQETVTDDQGRFRFAKVPTEMPVRLCLSDNDYSGNGYRLAKTMYFDSGEARLDAVVRVSPFLSNLPGYPSWSAFTGVRWEDGKPIVRVNDQWYELFTFHGVTVQEILDECKKNGWSAKRGISRDLVQIIRLMGHQIDRTTSLNLLDETGGIVTMNDVIMSEDNLQATRGLERAFYRVPGYPRWTAFTGLKWEGDKPIVHVNNEWYELVSFHGIPTIEILDACKKHGWDPRKRVEQDLVQIVRLMGHKIDKTTDLVLRDEKGRVVAMKNVVMTSIP